jgi:hypothetical protein
MLRNLHNSRKSSTFALEKENSITNKRNKDYEQRTDFGSSKKLGNVAGFLWSALGAVREQRRIA